MIVGGYDLKYKAYPRQGSRPKLTDPCRPAVSELPRTAEYAKAPLYIPGYSPNLAYQDMAAIASLRTAVQLQLNFLDSSSRSLDQDEALAWALMRADFEELLTRPAQTEWYPNVAHSSTSVGSSLLESRTGEEDGDGHQTPRTWGKGVEAAIETISGRLSMVDIDNEQDHRKRSHTKRVRERNHVGSNEDSGGMIHFIATSRPQTHSFSSIASSSKLPDWSFKDTDDKGTNSIGVSGLMGNDHSTSRTGYDPAAECLGCFDWLSKRETKAIKLDCGHVWCEPCINTMFRQAAKTEADYPAKCCMKLGVSSSAQNTSDRDGLWRGTVGDLLSTETRALYAEKSVEYETPTEDRTYCANTHCRAFLSEPPRANLSAMPGRKEFKRCIRCHTNTCLSCQGLMGEHNDIHGRCPKAVAQEAEEEESTLNLAKQRQWARCPKCKAVVEKTEGCNHMM